jgi:hypothetical protein
MYSIDETSILEQTKLVEEDFIRGGSSPLMFDEFVAKYFLKHSQESQYPREVRIPKPLSRLKKGDAEPERILRFDGPILYKNNFPIWEGNSHKGINLLGLGYKNGDSRYPSSAELNDKDIHAIAGGMTGGGKSVLLDSIIQALALKYAPWELKITLADAKIAGFKKYAVSGGILPHTSSIAATTDAEYIISVLTELRDEMIQVNAMFSEHGGTDNLIKFREYTGLNYPRNLIVVDEFQTLFKNAAKKAKIIQDLLDDFARLGRSTGYHLLLASQEPGEIPTATLNNINVRMALGCMPDVSNKLLGNTEANMNLGAKGRLIINTKPGNADKKDNVHYRVPYQGDQEFKEMLLELDRIGTEVGFRHKFSFYNEESLLNEEEFRELISSKGGSNKKIYLGEPSFVMRDKDDDNYVRLEFTGDEIENMMVWCDNSLNVVRYSKMIKENLKAMGSSVFVNVISADKKVTTKIGLEELNPKILDGRDADSPAITAYLGAVYYRKIALEAEEQVFSQQRHTDDNTDTIFYMCFDKGSSYDTMLNRYRCYHVLTLSTENSYVQGLKLGGLSGEDLLEARKKLIINYIKLAEANGCKDQMMTYNHLKPVFNWIVGLDKVLGWGRDSKNNKIENFKKVLQDCSAANIRFILTTTTITDLNGLASGIRYYLMEGVTDTQARKVGAEEFPETVSSKLGVLFDRYAEGSKEPLKFKKMIFMDE